METPYIQANRKDPAVPGTKIKLPAGIKAIATMLFVFYTAKLDLVRYL